MKEDTSSQGDEKDEYPSDPKRPTCSVTAETQPKIAFTVTCGCPVLGVATVKVSSGWKHALEGHPEVNKDHLIDAISNPVAVITDTTRPLGTGYVFQGRKKVRPGSKSKVHAFVKVFSESKEAVLSTAFYMRKPPKGPTVWTGDTDADKEE